MVVLIRPIAQLLALLVVVGGVTGLSAQTPGAQLILSWLDHATDEEGYLVERRAGAAPAFTQVAYLGPDAAGYLDAAVSPGGNYCYRVRAFNSAGISAYSSEVCGTAAGVATLPLAVTLNQATFRSADTLVATVHAVAGIVTAPIDAYVVVQAGGALFSLQLDGRLVPGLVPLARGVVLPSGSAPFAFPLAGAPPGSYTWIAGITAPGTLSLMSPLSTTPFTIVP